MKRSYFFVVLCITLISVFCGAANPTMMGSLSDNTQSTVPVSVPTKPAETLVAPDVALLSDGTEILLKTIPFGTYFKVVKIDSKKYGITATAKKAEASTFIVGLDGTDFTFKSPDAKTDKGDFLFMQLADRNVIQFVNTKITVREKWALRVVKSDSLKDARIQSKLNGAFVMACDPVKPTTGRKLGEVCGTNDSEIVSGADGLCKLAVNFVTTMPEASFYGGDSATSVAVGSRLGSFLLLAIGLDGKLRRYDPEDIKPWGVMSVKDEVGTDIVGLDSVEATSDGSIYINDKSGKVYRYDWDAKAFKLLPPGSDSVYIDQLSVGKKGGEDFVLGVDLTTKDAKNTLYQYDFKKPGWVARTDADECMYVATSADGETVLVIDPTNQVFKLKSIRTDGSFAWKQMPDITLTNVALGDKNTVYGTYRGKSYQLVGDKWVEEKDKTGRAVYGIRDQRFNAVGSRVMLDLDLYIMRVGESAVPYVAPKPVVVDVAKDSAPVAAPVVTKTVKPTTSVTKKSVKQSTIAKLGAKPEADDAKTEKARTAALAGIASKAQKAQSAKGTVKAVTTKTKAVKKPVAKSVAKKGDVKKAGAVKATKASGKKVATPAAQKSAPAKSTTKKPVEA